MKNKRKKIRNDLHRDSIKALVHRIETFPSSEWRSFQFFIDAPFPSGFQTRKFSSSCDYRSPQKALQLNRTTCNNSLNLLSFDCIFCFLFALCIGVIEKMPGVCSFRFAVVGASVAKKRPESYRAIRMLLIRHDFWCLAKWLYAVENWNSVRRKLFQNHIKDFLIFFFNFPLSDKSQFNI